MLTMKDYFSDTNGKQTMMKQGLIAEITTHNNKITKAMELLLNGDIEAEDFKSIKVKAEEAIVRLEAKTFRPARQKSTESKIQWICTGRLNLKKLGLMYLYGTIEQKRMIIG
jgi:site-specific DNA recombinase